MLLRFQEVSYSATKVLKAPLFFFFFSPEDLLGLVNQKINTGLTAIENKEFGEGAVLCNQMKLFLFFFTHQPHQFITITKEHISS